MSPEYRRRMSCFRPQVGAPARGLAAPAPAALEGAHFPCSFQPVGKTDKKLFVIQSGKSDICV